MSLGLFSKMRHVKAEKYKEWKPNACSITALRYNISGRLFWVLMDSPALVFSYQQVRVSQRGKFLHLIPFERCVHL